MIFVGDYIAIGFVLILFLFYFDGKPSQYFFTQINKVYVACLFFTAATSLTDLLACYLINNPGAPYWLNLFINTLYFIVNIVASSYISLFLFTKILEYAHDNHCMIKATCGLRILFSIYLIFVISNLWNGWLFYFDEHGIYHRGPLNGIGYIIVLCQMVLVLICFFRNRKNASRPMKWVLLQTFPIVLLCIIIQRTYPFIMLNGLIMALMNTVLSLTFQGQRPGIHTLTKLNDRHRSFRDVESRIAANNQFQIFLINIKNFGEVNQKFGHMAGDEILYQFAFSLENLIKNSLAFHMNGTVISATPRILAFRCIGITIYTSGFSTLTGPTVFRFGISPSVV